MHSNLHKKFYSCKKWVLQGMSWMKLHKSILDIAKRLVYLDSPIYGRVVLHLPVIVHIEASVHHTVWQRV
jgi:hypothetical protein